VYDALVKEGKAPTEPPKRTLGAPPADSPFRGARGAKILVQEVGDFQCPFCARAESAMDELLKIYPGQIKVVWRDKPLPMHHDAPLAAEAAREAFVQKGVDGFDRMRKLLFANPRALQRADLEGYAREISLDGAKFAAALDSHRHRAAIEADVKAAETAGVRGTPAFFVGPYWVEGAESLRRFRRLAELAGAKPVTR
jgi:protein-disulfide isomerase